MKLGFNAVTINPIKPVKKFGPGNKEVLEVKGDLEYKLLILGKDDTKPYILVCLPIGGVKIETTQKIKQIIEDKLGYKIDLTLACSHTHYSVRMDEDEDYLQYASEILANTIQNTETRVYENLSYSRVIEEFNEVGKCRISDSEAHVYLETLCLYENAKRIATIVVYNSHPTTMNFNEDFLSSVGPGLLQKKLEEKYKNEFFGYMIGAAGDVSTRFTRKEQTYSEVERLTEIVFRAVDRQLQNQPDPTPVNDISFEEVWLSVDRKYLDISTLKLPENATPREKETLEFGRNHGDRDIKEEDLPKTVLFQRLKIQDFSYIFAPFELFSEYLTYMDIHHGILVNCANDHACYLSGFKNKYMTFELFGESISKNSKEKLVELFQKWSS